MRASFAKSLWTAPNAAAAFIELAKERVSKCGALAAIKRSKSGPIQVVENEAGAARQIGDLAWDAENFVGGST